VSGADEEPSRPGEEGYAFLEHTADVGIRAWGATTERAFEQAALGLAELLDARGGGEGRVHTVGLSGSDAEALLVDFLNELIVLLETHDAAIAGVHVSSVSEGALRADVTLGPRDHRPEGVVVKAATYHRLSLERRDDGGVEAHVYLDV
jgi:SHS2 domain-containing protein